jgi:GT2 family glycosyltransferase
MPATQPPDANYTLPKAGLSTRSAGDVAPDLSIIIVNWNTRELLAECLASVSGSRLQVEGPAAQSLTTATFIVDNASTDGSATMVRERFPWVRLIENPENVGFARANNQGLAQAQGRYVLLLNPDTEVHPGALEVLVAFMDAHPRAGACGARLLNADGSLQPACHSMLTPDREFWRLLFLERLWPRATYRMGHWDSVTPRRVEVIKGACLLLRREALDQVGTLDESYFMYTEEVDLCYRLAAAGWELWYVPAAVVTHYGEASSGQVREEMYLQLYRSKVQFYRKFGGAKHARLAKVLLALAYTPRAVVVSLAALAQPAQRTRAHLYRRFLAELPGM